MGWNYFCRIINFLKENGVLTRYLWNNHTYYVCIKFGKKIRENAGGRNLELFSKKDFNSMCPQWSVFDNLILKTDSFKR